MRRGCIDWLEYAQAKSRTRTLGSESSADQSLVALILHSTTIQAISLPILLALATTLEY